jgi:hypothetical protein
MSTYDIDAERTDEKPKSEYLSKKDFLRMGIGIVVLGIILWPAYVLLKQNAESHLCKSNVNQLYQAINLYASENNGRLPPVYVTTETDAPYVERGAAYAWVHLIDGYVKDNAAFTCPSADLTEGVPTRTSHSTTINLDYGMYAPLGGEPIDQIEDPDESIMLGETANMGAGKTFDPLPFKDGAGTVVPFDGFVIAFNDSNLLPTKQSQFVTRLAFDDTADGIFKPKGPSRHRDGIHFLTVSGHLRTLGPTAAEIHRTGTGDVTGLWAVPKARKFRN